MQDDKCKYCLKRLAVGLNTILDLISASDDAIVIMNSVQQALKDASCAVFPYDSWFFRLKKNDAKLNNKQYR